MISRKYLILVATTGMLVSLDQLSKFVIATRFQLGEIRVVVEEFFNLTLVRNTGAAFGLFSTLPPGIKEPFFYIVPGITLALILGVFYHLKASQSLSVYALSLIVGGAVGNLMDRLRVGYVVDFLDFHYRNRLHFPAFNLADAAITLGVLFLFLSVIFERESREDSD